MDKNLPKLLCVLFFIVYGFSVQSNPLLKTFSGNADAFAESVKEAPPSTDFTSNLPIIIINTDENFNLNTDNNKVKRVGGMRIIYDEKGGRNDSRSTNYYYEGRITLKVRGQSSTQFNKKQYSLDTRTDDDSDKKKVSLFDMPTSNKWVISAMYSDKTLMRNALPYLLARQMGQWAARTRFCEVIINGQYRGVYVFQEKVKRAEGRVDITKLKPEKDITGGYIFSIDKTNGDEITWQSNVTVPNYRGRKLEFQFVDPDEDDLDPDKNLDDAKIVDYLSGYVDDFQNALKGASFSDPNEGFRKYIEPQSFVINFIINEISKNVDGFRISSYFFKDKGGKINAGPVWDYDIAWGNANYYDGANAKRGFVYNFDFIAADNKENNIVPFWWGRLRQDEEWEDRLRYTYHELRKTILSNEHIYAAIDSMATELTDGGAITRNFQQWDILKKTVWPNPQAAGSYQGEVNYLKNWIGDRLAFLDEAIPISERPLLLTFINFKVQPQNGYNQLTWEVDDYTEVDYFAIERADDSGLFAEIGRVPFSEDAGAFYHYQDKTPIQTSALYRIKEVALSGAASYSNVVSVKNSATGVWKIMPNRVRNNLTAIYSGTTTTSVRAIIYNANGQKVADGYQSTGNRISLNVSHLASGMYILEIMDGSSTRTHLKFVKE